MSHALCVRRVSMLGAAAALATVLAACAEQAMAPDATRAASAPLLGATPYQHNAIGNHDDFDIDFSTWSPQWIACAANGSGEWVDTYGTLHAQEQWVVDASANGVWHGESIFNGQNTWAVGRTTGTIYRAPSVSRSSVMFKLDGSFTSSSVLRLRYVGLGSAGTQNSFFLDAHFHYTVNGNLEPVVTIEQYEFSCPGQTPDPAL